MQLSAFDQLGVSTTAGDDEIKSAYLSLVKVYSPDKDPTRFQALRHAYEQIATQEQRLSYTLFQKVPLGMHDLLTELMKKETPSQVVSGSLLCSLIKENLDAR